MNNILLKNLYALLIQDKKIYLYQKYIFFELEKNFLNLVTKFQKRRRERLYFFCKEYVSYASQIIDNEITPWRVICGIADKYSVSANTVLVALRHCGVYRSKTEPMVVDSIAKMKEIL